MINRRIVLAGARRWRSSAPPRCRRRLEGQISGNHLRGDSGRERLGRHRALRAVRRLSVEGTRHQGHLRVANDYAAVIEGQRAGNIQIGYYGPASFARARLTGVKTDAFVIDVNSDGSKGYYSVFYVLAKSPYQKLEDLKGKNLGLVDPNSTSGNNMPRFKMTRWASIPTSSSRRWCSPAATRTPCWRWRRAPSTSRQLVERRQRLQPDAHAEPRAWSRIERRHADEEGGLPHHREVGSDRFSRIVREESGRVQAPVRWRKANHDAGQNAGLRRHGRADQIRRFTA
jgi:hypothetical protein